jgi:hypothetical protein
VEIGSQPPVEEEKVTGDAVAKKKARLSAGPS